MALAPLSSPPQPDNRILERTPAEAALETQMLAGYKRRARRCGYTRAFVNLELLAWRQFGEFARKPFTQWTFSDMDSWGEVLMDTLAFTTARNKQGGIRRIQAYARDPAYDWDERCVALTGQHIPQVCTLENTIRHRHGAATTKRRNLTDAELNRFFDTIKAAILEALAQGGDAPPPACWHFGAMCHSLAFGMREFGVVMGDLADLHPAKSPEIAAFSAFEDFECRFGKGYHGSGYKRYAVTAIAIFAEYFEGIDWYLREVRPLQVKPHSPESIFLDERGNRPRADRLSTLFRMYANRAGLSKDLTHHCLRHTFETKLRESGLDLATIATLMGHDDEATSLIYDHLRDETFRQRAREHNRQLLAECAARRAAEKTSCGSARSLRVARGCKRRRC